MMPNYVYVAAQDDNQIAVFTIDGETGRLTRTAEIPMPGGPSLLAIRPNRQCLYVGHRQVPEISSHRIDPATGALTRTGSIAPPDPPGFLATDRRGRYLLAAYYQGGRAAVHPLGEDGAIKDPPSAWVPTAVGAHAIQTDRSNCFAFVPHIARLNDNVLEPPKNAPGPNAIYQFRFDETTGDLTPNTPPQLAMAGMLGPRHYCFHPSQDVVYFSDEQGCSVTGYRLDPAAGTLSAFQTISTLPEGHTGRNTCSQIQLTPSGKFLYVPNRGHNSIAGFAVAADGRLTAVGRVATEAVPSAFSLDPEGKFVYAAGSATGRLASYRIHGETGELTPLETYNVGQRPMWVLTTRLGDA
jgi:6-phosphogluconolactonase